MLLGEAAVALAGFSGVVVVFGRRSAGEWSELERTRLVNLLVSAFEVLFLSLGALLLLHAHVAPAITWRIGSGATLLLIAYQSIELVRRLRTISTDDPEVSGMGLRVFFASGHVVVVLLSLANVVVLEEFWPFLAALIWSLGLGCSAFARLLLFIGRGRQGEKLDARG